MSRKLTTIIYHRVLNEPDLIYKYEPTIKEFDSQIRWLSSFFQCLTVSQATEKLKKNKLPLNVLCITFDDGYNDFYTNAFPILKKYKIPATLYVTSNCLSGMQLWNEILHSIILNPKYNKIDCSFFNLDSYKLDSSEKRIETYLILENKIKYLNSIKREQFIETLLQKYPTKIADNTMLNKKQLIELNDAGIEIGSHTLSHPILSSTSQDQARREITDSKKAIEKIINTPVKSFAYPNGKIGIDYNQLHINYVKEAHYSSALSSNPKPDGKFDIFQIPRFSPAKHQGIGLLLRIIKNKF